jgi:HEAT repeat protein
MRRRSACALLLAGLLAAGCGGGNPKPPDAVVSGPAAGPTPAELVEQWVEATPRDQAAAAEAVVKLDGEQRAEAARAVAAAIKDKALVPNPVPGKPGSTREAAVALLLRLGPAGEEALQKEGLPALAEGLKDADPKLRTRTAMAVALAGPRAKSLAKDVAALARAKDEQVRSAAYLALRRLGPAATPEVLALLADKDRDTQTEAAGALDGLRPLPAEAVAPLVKLIDQTTPRVAELGAEEALSVDEEAEFNSAQYIRRKACEALESVPPDGLKAHLPTFVAALRAEPVRDVEFAPAELRKQNESGIHELLRHLGPAAVPALGEALAAGEPAVRWHAAKVLGTLGSAAKPAAPALEKAMGDPSLRVGMEAAYALVRVGAEPKGPLDFLAKQLDNEDPEARFLGLAMLGRMGRLARDRLPAMAARLKDAHPFIRGYAARVLVPQAAFVREAAGDLAALLADPSVDLSEEGKDYLEARPGLRDDIRTSAARALGGMGPAARPALPALVAALKEGDAGLRQYAADALRQLGPEAKAAVPELIKGATSPNEEECLRSIATIGAVGPAAKEAVPTLLKLMDYKNTPKDNRAVPAVRRSAAAALADIAAAEAVGPLTTAMTADASTDVRIEATRALSRIGPAAKSALPELEKIAGAKGDPVLKLWASLARARIAGGDLEPFLTELATLLHDTKTRKADRDMAVLVLAEVGPVNAAALAEITELARDKKLPPAQKGAVVRSLGKAPAATAKEAVTLLVELSKENDATTRTASVEALGELGPKAKDAAARLRDLADRGDALSPTAAVALEKVGG